MHRPPDSPEPAASRRAAPRLPAARAGPCRLAVAAVVVAATLSYLRWGNGLEWDGYYYYEYIRWWLIDGYLTAQMLTNAWAAGASFFWLPFALAAHLVVLVGRHWRPDWVADGISGPYVPITLWGTVVWGLAGAYLAHRLLRQLYRRWVSCAAVFAAVAGSSISYYLIVSPSYAHFASFFSVTLLYLAWFTNRGRRRARGWLAIGLCSGLAFMARWQNALFFLIPALDWTWQTGLDWRRGRGGLAGRLAQGAALAVGALAGSLPQLLYWQVLYGRWVVMLNQGESLVWTYSDPMRVLFTLEHGLITWTPIFALALLGMIPLARRSPALAAGLTAGFILQVYLNGASPDIYSTSGVNFGGLFGSRRFCNSTLFAAAGFAAVLDLVQRRLRPARLGRAAAWGLAAAFVIWNVLLQAQVVTGAFRYEGRAMVANQWTMAARAARAIGRADARQAWRWLAGSWARFERPPARPIPAGGVLIGATGVRSPLGIRCRSSLLTQGYHGSIEVGGQERGLQRRGLNLVLIDPWSGDCPEAAAFNPFERPGDLAGLADWVAHVPEGMIVAVALKPCTMSENRARVEDILPALRKGIAGEAKPWQNRLADRVAFIPLNPPAGLARQRVRVLREPFDAAQLTPVLAELEPLDPRAEYALPWFAWDEQPIYAPLAAIGLEPGSRFGLPFAAVGVKGAAPGTAAESVWPQPAVELVLDGGR